jgi:hypothetical protein
MPTLFELYCQARALLCECELHLMEAYGPMATWQFTLARGDLVCATADYEVATWPYANADALWLAMFLACQQALDALDAGGQRKAAA